MSREGYVAVFVGKVLLAAAVSIAICGELALALPVAVTGLALIAAGNLA